MSSPRPLPGSPDMVRDEVSRLSIAASNMGDAATRIGKMSSYGGYSSSAVQKASENADKIESGLRQGQERYDGAASALREWAVAMERSQAQANTAIRNYEKAQTAKDNAEKARDAADLDRSGAGTPEEQTAANARYNKAEDQRAAAIGNTQVALQDYVSAKDDYNNAAKRCVAAIRSSNDKHGDTTRDRVVAKAKSLKAVLDTVATVLFVVLLIVVVLVVIAGTGGTAAFGAPSSAEPARSRW